MTSAKTALFSLLPTLALLLVGEVSARLYERSRPTLIGDPGLGFDESSRVFSTEASRPGWLATRPRKALAFPAQSFEQPKPKDRFRLVAIGESSVNLLSSNIAALSVELGRSRELRAAGYGSADAIDAGGHAYGSNRLTIVAGEVAGYAPDVAIVYIGNNEFHEFEQLALLTRPAAAALPAGVEDCVSHSALFRVLRDRVARRLIAELEREHDRRLLGLRPNVMRAERHRFTDEEAADRMIAFESNLGRIVDALRRSGARVFIGTIPSNLIRPMLRPERSDAFRPMDLLLSQGRYAEARDFAEDFLAHMPGRLQASSVENAVIRKVAAAHGAQLVDFAAEVAAAEPHHVPGETLFVDHCHLNESGKRLWQRVFGTAIRSYLRSARVHSG